MGNRIDVIRHPGQFMLVGKRHALGVQREGKKVGMVYGHMGIDPNDSDSFHYAQKGFTRLKLKGGIVCRPGEISVHLGKHDVVQGDSIFGNVETTPIDIRAKGKDSENITPMLRLPAGTKHLDLNFVPRTPFLKETPDAPSASFFQWYSLKKGLEDYLTLLQKIQTDRPRKLKDVQHIRCETFASFGNVASRFGFLTEARPKDHIKGPEDPEVVLWGEINTLISRIPQVERAISQLERSTKHREIFETELFQSKGNVYTREA